MMDSASLIVPSNLCLKNPQTSERTKKGYDSDTASF